MSATNLSSTSEHPLNHTGDDALEQAADWFALLRSGEASAADRAAWQAWCNASEANRSAWAQVENIGRRFQPIQTTPNPRDTMGAYRLATVNARRRRLVLGLLTIAGTGSLGILAWRHSPAPIWLAAKTADHRTAMGEVRQITLSDGSTVWLGTASAFDEDFSTGLRRLYLRAGEMLIATAADSSRPFVVDTPHGRLRALGTRFTVRLDNADTRLAVYDGAVQARAAEGAIDIIRAGQEVRMSKRGLTDFKPTDPARESSTRGLFIAQHVPLHAVMHELERYRMGHISLSPDVANLAVFGSYPMTDPDRTLAMLESVMPIRVRRPLPWWIRIEAR
ncbi:FecR domain-containing protein [Schauerella aestuarii]|uniref:FecR domain-containing protein n=1 Tax=Schauerella aestuarii TaxID=2511204 RepID=UPI001F1E2733|nr:FecR family protein [Achromobacter aestuarii]